MLGGGSSTTTTTQTWLHKTAPTSSRSAWKCCTFFQKEEIYFLGADAKGKQQTFPEFHSHFPVWSREPVWIWFNLVYCKIHGNVCTSVLSNSTTSFCVWDLSKQSTELNFPIIPIRHESVSKLWEMCWTKFLVSNSGVNSPGPTKNSLMFPGFQNNFPHFIAYRTPLLKKQNSCQTKYCRSTRSLQSLTGSNQFSFW